jgi:hypothetical protein
MGAAPLCRPFGADARIGLSVFPLQPAPPVTSVERSSGFPGLSSPPALNGPGLEFGRLSSVAQRL